jgi:uncharacterized protein YciI
VPYFAVTVEHGPAWDDSRPMREQDEWDAHARYMDELVDDGFIVLGGPLAAGERVLMAVAAEEENEIESRFAADPWRPMGLLVTARIEPWEVLLDGRESGPQRG